MKNTILTALLLALISSVFTACSTKRYGRLQTLSPLEKDNLTCKNIRVEIDKANYFLKHVNVENDKLDQEYLLGILGDLGIGNRMEFKEARNSVTKRIDELEALQKEKSCS